MHTTYHTNLLSKLNWNGEYGPMLWLGDGMDRDTGEQTGCMESGLRSMIDCDDFLLLA